MKRTTNTHKNESVRAILPKLFILNDFNLNIKVGQKVALLIDSKDIRNLNLQWYRSQTTSALDSENEKIVQEALDRAQENRISVTIAHRLSTILNSDLICVIHNGRIVEYGTHKELIVLNGHYYRLA
ncbi:unnamed protein product [Rotaria sp. Silwood1]|nr:unnamed protein product [Rotaria sp. Silwood1]